MGRAVSPDTVNLAGYSKSAVARFFGDQGGYCDQAERVVFEAVAQEMAGKAILDIGVGGGRTVPLLRAISDNYAAIDFSAEMVRLCRRLHPGVAIDVGDARDLSAFGTATVDLVVFSCAGIDHVDHNDRQQILGEVLRVLGPGGAFVFSTHNKLGRGHGEKPWGSRRELTQLKHMAGLALFLPINLRHHLRYRKFDVDADGWSIRNSAFNHFGMVFHYTTAGHEADELVAAGFQNPTLYEGLSGRRLGPGEETDTWHLYVIARR